MLFIHRHYFGMTCWFLELLALKFWDSSKEHRTQPSKNWNPTLLSEDAELFFFFFPILNASVPGPAVPYAPRGPSPAIHSRAGSKTFLDHLQRHATALPAHTSWRATPRQGKCILRVNSQTNKNTGSKHDFIDTVNLFCVLQWSDA